MASQPRTHGVAGNGSTFTETLKGFTCGLVFGFASPLTSHPFDVIKSRMQALPSAATSTSIETARALLLEGGPLALYKGLLPPMIGSITYRSMQMSAYSGAYAACKDSPLLSTPQPFLAGLQLRVLLAGAAATTARALVETPLEVLKVRQQLSLVPPPFSFKAYYQGFSLTWGRLYIALGGFFTLVDHVDRHYPWFFSMPIYGSFLKGAVCATASWCVAWPLEVVKNRVQSGNYPGSFISQFKSIVKERGVVGLYRGIWPGAMRSLIGNGSALAAYDLCKANLQ